MTSITEAVTGRTGIALLRRHWRVETPRAAVLIVHGIAEHSGRYEYVGNYLAERGFDTLSFDLRGHGESQGRRGHIASFDDFLDDVEELLDERRELEAPVVLMGHSLGGLIAATYVVSGRPPPDLLVLSAPALAADVPGWQRVMANVFGSILPKMAIKNDFDGALLSRDATVGEIYRDDPLRVRVATARLGKEIFDTMTSTAGKLDLIKMPTYVFHGSDDRLVRPSASQDFDKLPLAKRVVHERLRHECLNESERDDVLAELTDWLDTQLDSK